MTRPAPRTLLIAEAANPEWVSVPLVGWSLATALRRRLPQAHIVTQLRNRDAFVRAGLQEGTDFTAIDSERLARPMWQLAERLRGNGGTGWTIQQAISSLTYPYFEHLVWKHFGPGIRAGHWRLVHRITPLSPTTQSLMAARCARAEVPFVLGPLNGGVPWPKGFEHIQSAEGEGLSRLRNAYKMMPGRRATLRHASAILAGSRHTASEIPGRFRDKVFWLPENGIDPARFNRVATPDAGPLRVGFVGRMVPYKGPQVLLQALAPLLRDGRAQLEMIGDGPLLAELKAQAGRLGVTEGLTGNMTGSMAGGVRFHGWQSHERVQDILSTCHVLGFPSIREFGGGVVLEAMALGVVPVVADYGGPGELVTADTGFRLPCTDPDTLTRGFSAAFESLADDRAMLPVMAKAARARVARHFEWDRKAEQIARVYDWVSDGGPKPDLFAPAAAFTAPAPCGGAATQGP